MNQDFTCKQLMRLCKSFEWEKYNIKKGELENQINKNYDLILQDKFSFTLIKKGRLFFC